MHLMWISRCIPLCLSALGLAAEALSQTPVQAAETHRLENSLWRTAKNCGVNSLFLLLRAHGHNLSYERVQQVTPVSERGSTLPELHEAARQLGVETRIGKGKPIDLTKAQLPVVILLDPSTGDSREPGHFVVLTEFDWDSGRVRVFDGTSALETAVKRSTFQRDWSGYVLEVVPANDSWLKLLVSSVTAISVVLVLRRRLRTWSPGKQEQQA